ncbi:DUF2130 domain-containing protein [Helicobacter turcicus]|uniref:DUF2130 domain-containing protein n=1 Tax=Helicobacter turcicus TaxID=2867412 RepID=A0ABS7JLD5_9HELI|nr:DUF2130 domain-containing protein [Helicobacter turcicus]MBX7490215.1 DUF2130 domain-containing protein [Helicobacter turcicus]MBX7545206.1 DUF2130 domain-containing protein [Helicobacter turcicus]
MQEKAIRCPNCGAEIDVQSVVYQQIYAQLQREQQQKAKDFENEMQQKYNKYQKALSDLKSKEESLQSSIENGIKQGLQQERIKMQESIKKEMLTEYQEALNLAQKELQEKSNQVKELNASKIEIERLKREKSEIESKINAQAQEQLTLQMQAFKEKTQQEMESQHLLKLKEKDKQLEDLQKQLQDAQRKATISSQKLQGEVQELAIEEYLQAQFPFDSITGIKNGQSGGDCVQIVHTREIQNCGIIYYESKRTKYFQREWIEKLKNDMRQKGADIGVIVTEVLPKELERMGLLDGIWVCRFEEFKALALILRESVIKVFLARKTTENKQDKTQMLYSYLTSSEFKMQIEAIVEGFMQMQIDLDKEKIAMQKLWKQREKQIQKVLESSTNMYGALKGIAGNAISNIKALELDAD